MKTPRRTPAQRQIQIDHLLYAIQQKLDELAEIARVAADQLHPPRRRPRTGKKR